MPLGRVLAILTISLRLSSSSFGQDEPTDAKAQYDLGIAYWDLYVEKADAIKWLCKAAGQGHVGAQLQLARAYRNGEGVPKDDTESLKWLRKAVDQGNADAQRTLGLAYHEGTVVPKDDVEAVKWFRKAAESGNSKAQSDLGCAYHAGEGVPKDDVEAVKWFRKAADQGHAAAQRTIALAYHEGYGVPKDHTEFLKWLRKGGSVGGIGFAYFNRGLESYNPKNYEEEKNWDTTELVNWFSKELNKGGVPHTPKRGSAERQAVADGMRKFVMLYGSEPNPENKKIVTSMDYVKVLDQYALVEGIPLFDDGSLALCDIEFLVALKKIGNTWEPINYDARGDVGSRGEWVDFLKGLPSDFPLTLLTDLQKKIILGTFPDM
jgi:hypothetical protein